MIRMNAVRRNLLRRLAQDRRCCLWRIALQTRHMTTIDLGRLLYGGQLNLL